jgi:integrase
MWLQTNYYPFGTIVRLLLLTGCRRSEIGAMEWAWINDDSITVPGEHTKNGREHTLPITTQIQSILDGISATDKYLFPARGNTGNPFSGYGKCKNRLDSTINIPKWRLHDLRRTTATHMAQLGIQPHIIERILNHASGTISGVAAIYNRHAYRDEMSKALTIWHNKIDALCSEALT